MGHWTRDPRCPHVISGKVKPFQPKVRQAGPPRAVHHAAIVGPSAAVGSSSQASLSSVAPLAAEMRTPEAESAVQHALQNISHTLLAYYVTVSPGDVAVSPPLVTPGIVYAVTTSGDRDAGAPGGGHDASVPVVASTQGRVVSGFDLLPVKRKEDVDE